MKHLHAAAAVALTLLVAVAGCSKGSNAASATASPAGVSVASPTVNGAAASDGAKVYATNCASCHQAAGQGVEGTFPPLAGNNVVAGDPTKVIHILKYGYSGKITVAGKDYNGMMPAWAQMLSDADVASVITYIRSSWGNRAGSVSEAQVKAVTQ